MFKDQFPVDLDVHSLKENANLIIFKVKTALLNKQNSKNIIEITSRNETNIHLTSKFDAIKTSFITFVDKSQPDEFKDLIKNKYLLTLCLLIICSLGMVFVIVIVKSCQNYAYLRFRKKRFGRSTLELISSDFLDKDSEKGKPKITKIQCTLNMEKLDGKSY